MPQQIIKQPNGLYCIFSEIVDDFVATDMTKEGLIEYYLQDEKESITNRINTITEKLDKGEKYILLSLTYDQAVRHIKHCKEQDNGRSKSSRVR